jgi:hypothetical protein
MSTFIFALNAILPIIILNRFGLLLKATGFINDKFLEIANKLVFRIALPAFVLIILFSKKLGDIIGRNVFSALGNFGFADDRITRLQIFCQGFKTKRSHQPKGLSILTLLLSEFH